MTELQRHIDPDTDVPAGDIGVGGREIGYMFGQYKRIRNEFTGVLTGKGIEWGGSLIRPEATGYGVVYFVQEMLKTKAEELKNKAVLLSGSGNVAQYAAEKVLEFGGKVVSFSDSSGYVYDPEGINDEKLKYIMDLKNIKRGRIKEYADKYDVKYEEGKTPWGEKGDIALPCATQNEINEIDAENLVKNGCIAVSEGANMPSTPEAVEIFLKNKILYGPGKAANAGGVAVSGLEMTQNSMRLPWTRKEVDLKLQQIMTNIHETCLKYGKENDGFVNYVNGANIGGFLKVAEAMFAQGVV
jgi:glutamate dehydrogenase/leucine dehydrogenase